MVIFERKDEKKLWEILWYFERMEENKKGIVKKNGYLDVSMKYQLVFFKLIFSEKNLLIIFNGIFLNHTRI